MRRVQASVVLGLAAGLLSATSSARGRTHVWSDFHRHCPEPQRRPQPGPPTAVEGVPVKVPCQAHQSAVGRIPSLAVKSMPALSKSRRLK